MISHLSGSLFSKTPNLLVIESAGIGYEINISLSSYQQIGNIGDSTFLHIQMIVREDSFSLYGFTNKQEKEIFNKLISISGIGPKLAITILSGLSPEEFINTLQAENINRFVAIPGVGRKTAERLLVELRDKVSNLTNFSQSSIPINSETQIKTDVISALVNLGWQMAAAEKIVTQCIQEEGSSKDFSSILKQSINKLYKK